MGQIEKILTSMDPVISKNPRAFIRYYVKHDMMVFYGVPTGCEYLRILIRFTMAEGPRFYYTLYPNISYFYPDISDTFVKNRDELLRKREQIVFSGKNVYKYLQLGDPYEISNEGSLTDLHSLCLQLKTKKRKIIDAFSKEKIEETYNALISMDGNDEDEINRILKDLNSDV